MTGHVLVTGGTGFIGSALLPALIEAGHKPRVLARQPPEGLPPEVDIVLGDMAQPESLRAATEGADAVVHLAAATSAGRLDPAVAYAVNVGGASALIDACRASGCRRIVVLSTQHVHLEDCGLYGRTKRIADTLFRDCGLDVTILRPSLVYGRGERGVFVKLARLARQLPVIPVVGPGTWTLRPVSLDDVVEIIVQTLARDRTVGGAYDVGGRQRVSFNEMLVAICEAMGKPCRRFHLPLSISFMLAWVLERLLPNPPLTTDNVHGARLEAPCDLTALDRDYDISLTPLETGLRNALSEAS